MRDSLADQNANHYAGQAPPVSVVVLTCNEAGNIADCLDSCRWCDDVHVLDSGSSDATVDIARAAGAQVHYHPFSSFGRQRNWAIDNIATKHSWHFHLDADERFTVALVREMLKEIGRDGLASGAAAYLVPSKMIFMNKWLKYSGLYPTYQARLFHRDRCRFIDFGHGQREQANGRVATLVSPYLHYNFSKGMLDWFHKHNGYSDREADEAMEIGRTAPPLRQIFTGDALTRRRAIKSFSYRLRARALWRFLYMNLFRFGWLDAAPGFHYCTMIAMYEYWIEIKLRDKARDWTTANAALEKKLTGEAIG